jgi:MoaA/NifB/PqqE/SkfB family radical SAM enzyme
MIVNIANQHRMQVPDPNGQGSKPSLTRVYVEPTNTCNLKCRTCVRNSWQEPEGFMSMENYHNLIKGLRKADSLKKMSFWGFGEPLLHPNIVEMVCLAKELGVETQIITNALLLGKEKAEGLVDAGLDTLIISVDGASAEAYADIRPKAELELVKKNVNQLRDFRRKTPDRKPVIGIEYVVMQRNFKELRYLRQLAYSLGAAFIFLTNLLPYTEELKDEILYWFSTSLTYPPESTKLMPELFIPPMDLRHSDFETIKALAGHSGSICTPDPHLGSGNGYCRFVNDGSLVVAWDGMVSPCIALMHSYTCYIMGRQKQFKRYTLGDVGKEDITSLWGKKEFADFRDTIQSFPFSPCTECGGCDMAETNEEDCYGNPFPVCGDCLWAKGVIRCP